MIVADTEEKPLPRCTNCLNPTDPNEYANLDHTCQRCYSDFVRSIIGDADYNPWD